MLIQVLLKLFVREKKKLIKNKFIVLFAAAVVLVAGANNYTGTLFARNPTTGIYGPVCDDNFALVDVNYLFAFL